MYALIGWAAISSNAPQAAAKTGPPVSRPPREPCQSCPVAVFNTVGQMRDQLRAGEDGRAEFKELRLRRRLRLTLWAKVTTTD